jgi:anti-sigma B factor antagonist
MQIRQRHIGPVVCLDLEGRLVLNYQEGSLRETVNDLLSQSHRQIVLNLKDVSLIDTSGLAAMIAVKLAAQRTGGDIKLLHLPTRIYNLLVVTRLITVFDVFESEEEAAGSFLVTATGSAEAAR